MGGSRKLWWLLTISTGPSSMSFSLLMTFQEKKALEMLLNSV